MAVVLPPHPHRIRGEPALASIPAPFRPGTHLPVPQTNPGLDPAPRPHPRPSRPLDLAHHQRPHPAPAGPPPHPRPTPALGETSHRTPPANPSPHPSRVSEPPPEDHP